MNKSRILSTHLYCRDSELSKMARNVIGIMKDKPQFSNPSPALADVEKALNEFDDSLINASRFDRQKIAVKNEKRAVLRLLLTELVYYVTQACKGNRALLLESGFAVTVEKAKAQTIKPGIKVELPLPGEVKIRVPRVRGARSYIHEYTQDPLTVESVWVSKTTLKAEHTFTGFETAARLWFRIAVVQRDGSTIYWEPVLRIVQ